MYDLQTTKYFIVRNFISQKKAYKLSQKFDSYCTENKLKKDPDVINSYKDLNNIHFLDLLVRKSKDVSEYIRENVLPTFTLSRKYTNKSSLLAQTAPKSAEVCVVIHLNSDVKCDSYLINYETKVDLDLNPGDAVIYCGETFCYGIEEYCGHTSIQAHLHYVKSNGKNSKYFFDKIEDYSVETKSIKVYENVLSKEFCDSIINEYSEEDFLKSTTVGNDDSRKCKQVIISSQDIISKNQEKRELIDKTILDTLQEDILGPYHTEFSHMNITEDSGFILLKYDVGSYYTEHADWYRGSDRVLSCVIFLNDDYEGGELSFFRGKHKIIPKTGSIVLFPSNFMFPHEVLEVTKGTRYSIVTWFL